MSDRTSSARKTNQPVLISRSLDRDVEMLDPAARTKVRRLIDATAAELAEMKNDWVEELLDVHADFDAAGAEIRAERYEPSRRDELLGEARAEHLDRLRQTFERQTRRTSDYCLALRKRLGAVVAPPQGARTRAAGVEARLLAELLDLTKRTHVDQALARGDRAEIARSWQRAVAGNDVAVMDALSDGDPEILPPEAIEHRRRSQARQRITSADELTRWIQRERTVASAVYDSVAEAVSRT